VEVEFVVFDRKFGLWPIVSLFDQVGVLVLHFYDKLNKKPIGLVYFGQNFCK
jgi:hypothetical protein